MHKLKVLSGTSLCFNYLNQNYSILFDTCFCGAVSISFFDSTIWIFSNTSAIRIQNIFLTTCIFYSLHPILFNSLNCSICEYWFFFSICKNAFNCSVWKYYLFSAIREMLFYLLIWKFKYLKSIRICCLSSFSLCKVIYYFLIRIRLLNIIVIEINNRISIWESLSFHSIAENHFLFTI